MSDTTRHPNVPPTLEVQPQAPDRNLALEIVRVTESAAMAAARHVGRGDKNKAPMLFNGEEVGDGTGPEVDVAVDPIDGTTLTAKGMPNAVSVLAVSERHTMYDASACFYMEKLVTGPEAAEVVDLEAPIADNV